MRCWADLADTTAFLEDRRLTARARSFEFPFSRHMSQPTPKLFSIAIGSDHAGFAYKEAIKAMLLAAGQHRPRFRHALGCELRLSRFHPPVAERSRA